MEDGCEELALAALGLATCVQAYLHIIKKEKRRERSRSRMAKRSRSLSYNLRKEMCLEDTRGFYEFHRMSKENFADLLNLVSPLIKKEDTNLRVTVSPAQRLSVTLRYLATGESRRSLEFQCRISHNLICSIIPEVCRALYTTLKGTYLKLPTTCDEWQKVASTFNNAWQFPNCIGALDGKRFLIAKPLHSGDEPHQSVIMLALVDATYKFLYMDVGARHLSSDRSGWDKCNLRKYLEEQRLQVPGDAPLPHSSTQFPYVIVGDDAFPLQTNLMEPYAGTDLTGDQCIFNYRLSRARRVSKNAFGILAEKFHVFQRPINSKPEHVNMIICAAVVLHNFLRVNCKVPVSLECLEREDIVRAIVIPRQRQEAAGFERLQVNGKAYSKHAKAVRDNFKTYFMNDGKVAWQERMALHH